MPCTRLLQRSRSLRTSDFTRIDAVVIAVWVRKRSFGVLRRLDSSRKPVIMLHLCRDSLLALCKMQFRLATRQELVASLAMGHVAAGTSSAYRCAPGVGNHGAPNCVQHVTDQTLWLCRLIANTLRSADVHLVGSQPQSEIHSFE